MYLKLQAKHTCYSTFYRFSAVTYSDIAEEVFGFDDYSTKVDVIAAILKAQYMGGKTNTQGAFNMMVRQ